MTPPSMETLSRPCSSPEWYVFPLAPLSPVLCDAGDDLTGSLAFPEWRPRYINERSRHSCALHSEHIWFYVNDSEMESGV